MIETPHCQLQALAELAQLDQWVISKPVQRRGKIDKPPFSPILDGTHDEPWMCSHSNASHWASYQDAQIALVCFGFSWLGFVFHVVDPYSGIDIDGCAKPGVERITTLDDLEAWAQRIVELVNSYTEISPSGKGVKIFVRGKVAAQVTYSMGAHKGIEIYSSKRYFTVTGAHLPGTPLEIREAQGALDQLATEYKPAKADTKPAAHSRASVQPFTPRPGRASLADVKARFNAEHTLDSLLISYGATQTRDGYSCPFCTHTHETTLSISEEGRLFSYSPNCTLHTTKGWDAFGLYVKIEHGDDVIAAVKTLNPIEPKKRKLPEEPLEYSPAEVARRQAYNDKRRAARHAETLAALEALYDRVCNLSFTSAVPVGVNAEKHSNRARLLLIYLYGLAMESGCLQVAPINEKIATDLDWCERYVVYAFRELEASGIGKRQGGKSAFGNQPNQAATWTFFREPSPFPIAIQPAMSDAPNLGCKPDCDAECTPLYIASNTHDHTKELVRGGEQPAQVDSDAPAPKAESHQAAPEGASASYQPAWAMEWSDKPYTGTSKHSADFETRWAWSNEAIKLRDDAADVADQVGQAEIVPISPAKTQQKSNEGIVPIDRYHAKMARMTVAELRAEKRKLENTIRKHAKAFWVREVREKLALVERLLAEAQSQSKTGVGCAPRLTSWRAAPQPTLLQQTGFL
jgi:hypothetical protein